MSSSANLLWPVVGNLSGIASFLSPWSTVSALQSKKMTATAASAVKFFPLLSLLFNGIIWMVYGLVISDISVVIMNLVGFLCGFRYVWVYLRTVDETRGAVRMLQAAGVVCVVYVLLGILLPPTYRDLLGAFASVVAVVTYGAPLVTAKEIVQTGDVSSIIVPLVLCNTVCALSWTVHGYLQRDAYIVLPNAIGLLLSLIQLVLWLMYRGRDKKQPLLV